MDIERIKQKIAELTGKIHAGLASGRISQLDIDQLEGLKQQLRDLGCTSPRESTASGLRYERG